MGMLFHSQFLSNGGSTIKIDESQPVSLAMTIALAKDSSAGSANVETLDAPQASKNATGVPANLKFISLGMPSITLPAD